MLFHLPFYYSKLVKELPSFKRMKRLTVILIFKSKEATDPDKSLF